MTNTATDTDLERLLSSSPTCEILRRQGGQWVPCGQAAEWLIRTEEAECGHHQVDFTLACEICLRWILDNGLIRCTARGCNMALYIKQVIKL